MTARWRGLLAVLLLLFGVGSAVLSDHAEATAVPAAATAFSADLAADGGDALADAELLRAATSAAALPRSRMPIPPLVVRTAADRGDPPYRPPAHPC